MILDYRLHAWFKSIHVGGLQDELFSLVRNNLHQDCCDFGTVLEKTNIHVAV